MLPVISQLRSNQNIHDRGTKKTIQDYFNRTNKGTDCVIRVRGGEEVNAKASSARLKVDAHSNKKRFVIAPGYEGEEEYRYLVATDLSWRTMSKEKCSAVTKEEPASVEAIKHKIRDKIEEIIDFCNGTECDNFFKLEKQIQTRVSALACMFFELFLMSFQKKFNYSKWLDRGL